MNFGRVSLFTSRAGLSSIELLGVVALIAVVATISIVGIGNFSKVSRESATTQNVFRLNNAVEQFNQSGGLMTAMIPRPLDVAGLADAELPEVTSLLLAC